MRALSNKETKEFIARIGDLYSYSLSKKDRIMQDDNIFVVNSEPAFFFHEDKPVPTLKLLIKENFLKKIVVDMGAVKFVAGGADVMRPGIVKIDEGIAKDDFVSVVDVTHQRPLCVGKAMYSSEEMQTMSSGKVLKNIHYVGDKIWIY
jgi:PUA-domain protein